MPPPALMMPGEDRQRGREGMRELLSPRRKRYCHSHMPTHHLCMEKRKYGTQIEGL